MESQHEKPEIKMLLCYHFSSGNSHVKSTGSGISNTCIAAITQTRLRVTPLPCLHRVI